MVRKSETKKMKMKRQRRKNELVKTGPVKVPARRVESQMIPLSSISN